MSGFLAAGSGDWMRTESSAWVLTCFLRSWGRLNAFPQVGHLWGLRGTCTRICEVMWSRLTVVVLQSPHWQVRFRLLVLFRPTWRSQMCSWAGQHCASDFLPENSRKEPPRWAAAACSRPTRRPASRRTTRSRSWESRRQRPSQRLRWRRRTRAGWWRRAEFRA